MGKLEFLDAVNVPEVFFTHVGAIEDAGSGMVRVIRCIERRGVLIPVLHTVSPATMILQVSKEACEFARRVLSKDVGTVAH